MSDDELKALRKNASKKKRLATEWASQIHDLVEDRFLSDFNDLPEMAAKAVVACEEWAQAQAEYEAAEAAQ